MESFEENQNILQEGQEILGIYKVLGLLGRGDFGYVYKVVGIKGKYKGQIFALKVAAHEYALEQLWKEAQALILLQHPNIISLKSYLYKKEEKKLYVIYELMSEGDLYDYVQKNDISLNQGIKIFYDIVKGLSYLHDKGYIHSDLKPNNIFGKKILKGIVWKIGDFGLIKIRGTASIIDVKGTVGYIAPEVFKSEIHRSSDIFSLGSLLHYILTKRDVFTVEGEDHKTKLKRNKNCDYVIDENLPLKVREFLKMLLKCDYRERFKTAVLLKSYMEKEGVLSWY